MLYGLHAPSHQNRGIDCAAATQGRPFLYPIILHVCFRRAIVLGHFASKRLKKGNDCISVCIAEPVTQLNVRHDLHCFLEFSYGAVVKVWRGLRNIAEHGHAKFVAVGFLFRCFEEAIVFLLGFRGCPVLLGNAKRSNRTAAEQCAFVAIGAAFGDEELEARLLLGAQSAVFPGQKLIERRGGFQCSLVGLKSRGVVSRRHGLCSFRKRGLECGLVARCLEQRNNGFSRVKSHRSR